MKKKWFSTAAIALLVFTMLSVQSVQAAGVSLNVNGHLIEHNVPPVVKDGKLLIGVKYAADIFGSKYLWDNQSKTLTLSDDKFTVSFVLGSASAKVTTGTETKDVLLEQSAQEVSGSLMVPARFLVELFGGKVTWNPTLQTVFIIADEAATPGLTGAKGDKGEKGETGATGAKGDKGEKGDLGYTGSTGPAGATGATGATGPAGAAGTAGAKGDKGDKGDQGATGPAGAAGTAGAKGDKGDKGDQGATGPAGAAGTAGAKGDKGDKGDQGATGPAGAAGTAGAKGDKGDKGDQGATGPAGPAGTSYTSEGFSASGTTSVNASTQLMSWSVAPPNYESPTFEPTTGIFTAPATGKYAIHATINYKTTNVITTSLGANVNPTFNIKTINNTNLLKGNLPIFSVNIALVLTLRTILESATVTLSGDVELQAGDEVGLYYEANGLTYSLNTDTVWSIHRLN